MRADFHGARLPELNFDAKIQHWECGFRINSEKNVKKVIFVGLSKIWSNLVIVKFGQIEKKNSVEPPIINKNLFLFIIELKTSPENKNDRK